MGFFRASLLPRAVLGCLGASWVGFGSVLGPSWGHLGPSWGVLGAIFGHLGASWGLLGPSWGPFGAILGEFGVILDHLGATFEHKQKEKGEFTKMCTAPRREHHFWGFRGTRDRQKAALKKHLKWSSGTSWGILGSSWALCGSS